MICSVIKVILIPFLGTTAGSATVFFLKKGLGKSTQALLDGFAAGIMSAAGVWSLLIPSIEQSAHMGDMRFIPAAAGLLLGTFAFLLTDRVLPSSESSQSASMVAWAVTIHNIPEGMAVGVALAGWIHNQPGITFSAVLTLAVGIGLQNIPEGAIIPLPLSAKGTGRVKAFSTGILSGTVEPIGALIALLLSDLVVPALPYFLSFAAGAMLYVVVAELIPEITKFNKNKLGTISFAAGFSLMLALDVAMS